VFVFVLFGSLFLYMCLSLSLCLCDSVFMCL
jgi:hypothetical protein